MAKRVFKKDDVKKAIKNIADDFRHSGDLSDSALVFYKADADSELKGKDISQMEEYLTTGLKELAIEFKNLEWRKEFIENNPVSDEIQLVQNLKVIENEYKIILDNITN